MADVERAVGIGWTIVEEKGLRFGSVDKLPLVKRGSAALQVVIAKLRCRSWSGGLFSWCCRGRALRGTRGAYGKEALGSLMVDCHDFDMIPYIPCPRNLAELEGRAQETVGSSARRKFWQANFFLRVRGTRLLYGRSSISPDLSLTNDDCI